LAELPSLEELEEAVSKLNNGKAGVLPENGKSGMPGPCLPGLAARPCPHSLDVPEDWADAVIVPSPMKGNLV